MQIVLIDIFMMYARVDMHIHRESKNKPPGFCRNFVTLTDFHNSLPARSPGNLQQSVIKDPNTSETRCYTTL